MLKKIAELKCTDPFKAIFPINPLDLQAITDHMRTNGFDEAQPVIVWKGTDFVVDGFTRIEAAIANNIKAIHVVEKEFQNDIDAIKYTVHLQRDRRNLTPAQFTRLIETVDKRVQRGGDRKSAEFKEVNYKPLDDDEVADAIPNGDTSAELTADVLGISPATVQRARKIIDSDDPNAMKQLEQGSSINKVYTSITKKEKQAKEKETTGNYKLIKITDKSDWAGWVLNPIIGCNQGCDDCIYYDLTMDVYGNFDPQFFPERLSAITNTKVPGSITPKSRNVLLCEMGDMMNPGVEDTWIEQTVEALFDAPQWNFIVRTKFPERYDRFNWPENTWLGAVVTNQEQANHAGEVFANKRYRGHTMFLSCYPLLGDVVFNHNTLTNVSWILVGAPITTSKLTAIQPEWNWLENILLKAREHDCKVYFMNNLRAAPKEVPDLHIPEIIQKSIE